MTQDLFQWLPVSGEYNGRNHDRNKLRSFYLGQSGRLELEIKDPPSIIVDCERVVIEYDEAGTLDGAPVSNHVAVSYVIRGGKIVVSREYLGDLAPLMSG